MLEWPFWPPPSLQETPLSNRAQYLCRLLKRTPYICLRNMVNSPPRMCVAQSSESERDGPSAALRRQIVRHSLPSRSATCRVQALSIREGALLPSALMLMLVDNNRRLNRDHLVQNESIREQFGQGPLIVLPLIVFASILLLKNREASTTQFVFLPQQNHCNAVLRP